MFKRVIRFLVIFSLLVFGTQPAMATPIGEVPDADSMRSILRSQLPRPLQEEIVGGYLHYGIAFNGGQQALGNQISNIETSTYQLAADGRPGDYVTSRVCDDYADVPCLAAQTSETILSSASVILPVCSDNGTGACLESISISKNGVSTEGSFLEYVDNSISAARRAQILQQETDCCKANPANSPPLQVEIPASPEWSADLSRGLPAAKSPSKWRVANIQNKGMTDTYMARATVKISIDASGKVTFDSLSAEIVPYVETSNGTFFPPTYFSRLNALGGDGVFPGSPMYPIASFDNPNQVDPVTCAWEEELPTDRCGIAVQFADGTRTSMTIRIPSQLGGWFHGRVAKADLDLNTYNSTLNRLVISAEDVDVPTAGASFPILDPAFSTYKDHFYGNDPIGLQDILTREGATPSADDPLVDSDSGLGSFSNWSADQGVEAFSAVEPLMGDTADGSVNIWQFATLPQSETASSCFANSNRIQGMISTNAMVYQAGLPSFGSQGFTYQVGGLRKDYSGQTTQGSYSLIMRTEEARCLYGLGTSNFTSEVAVTDPSGANKTSQTSLVDDGTWLRIWADDFTFSSPRISTRLMKVAPTVALTPKIKISAKKQLSAKSALSAQSLRYLAKVKAKPGDKISISLQSGKKKNVDLKKSYIYFKKPGTYVVKVKVDRKIGPTVTKYIRVTVKK